jgi:predicted transcriptional regulator of viral defense system
MHLSLSREQAAHELARWAKAGWLARVRRGAYAPIPLQAASADIALEDAWIAAASLFAPCYIGGWSAAEHWGLTEQIFRSVCVITGSRPRRRTQQLRGTNFLLHSTGPDKLFGTQSVWRSRVRVSVSDPARTILDMVSDPSLGGGIRPVADALDVFLREHRKIAPRVIDYGIRLSNGAAFKRLGFLLERSHPDESDLIASCRAHLTAGYSKLDPKLACDRLITAWHLWIPSSWKPRRTADRPQ